MLTDSLTYLKDSDELWKTTLIGGVLLLFSFLFVPLFLVWGYVVRVLDRTSRGDDEAPVFEDWGELLVDGVKAVAILFAYSLVPAAIGAVTIGGVWLATGGSPGTLGTVGFLLATLLTLVAFAAAIYATPAAIAQFATEGRLRAGFAFETLRPALSTSTYAVGWLLAFGIVLGGSIVAGFVSEIPFVGPVLGAIATFYALVAAYYVIGHTWADLHPVSIDDAQEEPATDRPAI